MGLVLFSIFNQLAFQLILISFAWSVKNLIPGINPILYGIQNFLVNRNVRISNILGVSVLLLEPSTKVATVQYSVGYSLQYKLQILQMFSN